MDHPRASFLGLPPELRQNIYIDVCRLDINAKVIDRFKDAFSSIGFQCIPIRAPLVELNIPWLHLMSTCRDVRRSFGLWSHALLPVQQSRMSDIGRWILIHPAGLSAV